MRTVIQAGVDALFHYQPFRADYVEGVLLRHRIKFSDPRTFNDPWDCRPHFSKAILDDPKRYQQNVDYAIDIQRRVLKVPEPELTRRAEILKKDRAYLEARIDECSAAICEAIREKYRLYCLSALPDSFLMWAHYTGCHQGVCLGFTPRSDTFCGALEVTYSETYPHINFAGNDEMVYLRETLLTKAAAWGYEREFRLIAKEGESEGFLVVNDGFLAFSPKDLRMVVAGCSMSDANLQQLRSLIAKREVPVDLFRAQPAPDRYAITLQHLQK